MFDYHMHSHFSPDASMTMEEAITSSISKNLAEICFTDHVDYDYDGNNEDICFSYKEYFKTIDLLREKYKDKISIKQGVEFGLQPHLLERYKNDVAENPFDFIIGSIHSVEKSDLYIGRFFQNKSPHEAYSIYFEQLYSVISQYDGFSVLGHLDSIKRYGGYDIILPLDEFQEQTDAILKKLIEKDKGIEINTSGIRYKVGDYHPSIDIIKRYRELGGTIITLGSDSHQTHHVAYDFKKALQMLDEVGFEYICSFSKMEPLFHRIKNIL